MFVSGTISKWRKSDHPRTAWMHGNAKIWMGFLLDIWTSLMYDFMATQLKVEILQSQVLDWLSTALGRTLSTFKFCQSFLPVKEGVFLHHCHKLRDHGVCLTVRVSLYYCSISTVQYKRAIFIVNKITWKKIPRDDKCELKDNLLKLTFNFTNQQTLNHSFLLLMLSDICTAKTNPQLISIYHRFSV